MFHIFLSSLAKSRYLSFFSLFSVLFCGRPVQQSRQFCKFSFSFSFFFFLLITLRSGFLAVIRWSVCMSKSIGVYMCILQDCCWVVHIPFFRVVKFNFFAHLPVDPLANLVVSSLILACYNRLLCDWWFRLYHYIIYICYFIASYLFSLWFDWFLWHCFVLLLGEILFLF